MAPFDLPMNAAKSKVFGKTKVLFEERFDRKGLLSGRLLRVAQEDCCQANGVFQVAAVLGGSVQALDCCKMSRRDDAIVA